MRIFKPEDTDEGLTDIGMVPANANKSFFVLCLPCLFCSLFGWVPLCFNPQHAPTRSSLIFLNYLSKDKLLSLTKGTTALLLIFVGELVYVLPSSMLQDRLSLSGQNKVTGPKDGSSPCARGASHRNIRGLQDTSFIMFSTGEKIGGPLDCLWLVHVTVCYNGIRLGGITDPLRGKMMDSLRD